MGIEKERLKSLLPVWDPNGVGWECMPVYKALRIRVWLEDSKRTGEGTTVTMRLPYSRVKEKSILKRYIQHIHLGVRNQKI